MFVSVRRFLALALGALALLGSPGRQAHAQGRPIVVPLNPGLNQNPFVNPFGAINRFPNVAVLGQTFQNVSPSLAGYGMGYGMGYGGYGMGYGGYGTQSTYGGSSGVGGYGSLLTKSGYGDSGGYGGYGTQSMQNPYEGYLRGATAITYANAQYQLTIQQAKLVRQEAVRSALKTRYAYTEEADYERGHMPDPEKIRQAELARELDHARVDPPLTEIWSGKALNVLLRHLVKQQGSGEKGPNTPLSEDTFKWVNLTTGDSRANVGLLKDNGNLQWPQPLLDDKFTKAREDLVRCLRDAVNVVKVDKGVAPGTLKDLDTDFKELNDTLDANIGALSPSRYIEARRYLNLVGHAIQALKDPNVSQHFNQNWTAKSKNVDELVRFMGERGLWFAPATPGDEPAYRALYHALVAFDTNMTQTARGGGSRDDHKRSSYGY
jgi:hypothetical protein